MAEHDITRILIVSRDELPRLEGLLTLRQLLHARRVDLHEEQHVERHLTLRPRRKRSIVVASGTGVWPAVPRSAEEEGDPSPVSVT